jgi:hypothetical protein
MLLCPSLCQLPSYSVTALALFPVVAGSWAVSAVDYIHSHAPKKAKTWWLGFY